MAKNDKYPTYFFISSRETIISRREIIIPNRETTISRREIKK